jgi:hypothetical protein
MDEMSVLKSFTVAAALLLGLSTLTSAASRQRDRGAASYNAYSAYGAQSPTRAPVATGSYGGYSADPHTRALQELADKYRSGW